MHKKCLGTEKKKKKKKKFSNNAKPATFQKYSFSFLFNFHDATCPSPSKLLPPGPSSSTGPKSLSSSNSPSEFKSHPHNILLLFSLRISGIRTSRSPGLCEHNHKQFKSPNPDGQQSTLSDIGISRLGSSRFTRTQFTYNAKPRTPNLRCHLSASHGEA
jgi:hypothetical protein